MIISVVGVDGGSGGGDGFYLTAGSGILGQGNDGGDSPTSGGNTGDWNGGGGGGGAVYSSSDPSYAGGDGSQGIVIVRYATSFNIQDGTIFEEEDTNKEYVLYNNTWTEV